VRLMPRAKRQATITGDALIGWFRECGFPVPPGQKVSRIVIDAQACEAVKVYVEMLGTEAMLDVKPPDISPAQITVIGGREDE